MKNFQRLQWNNDFTRLAHEIARQPHLWDENKLRTAHTQSPHQEVNDIWLRFQDLEKYKGDLKQLIDDHESINYPATLALPSARAILFDLMRLVEGERLGRVLITKLARGKKIAAHVDGGEHAAYYDRYHVVLQGMPGSLFRAGDETVQMLTGEVWWFDNAVEHEVVNNSEHDRIHMVVDIRTTK